MKIYEIIDDEEKISVGCLLYFEKEKSLVIELKDNLDEWTAPLLFAGSVKKGKFTIGRELSRLWVEERIIPSGRQNIDSILANAKMNYYDEMLLLEKSGGKCSQDSMYIRKTDSIPEYILKRMEHNLLECVPCDGHMLLCFFADGKVKKVSPEKYSDLAGASKILSNEALFMLGHIVAGGYFISFNDSIDIDAAILYERGEEIPLSLNDFISFAGNNLLDTSQACSVLDCSRQNLTNYLSKKLLTPVKKAVKGNLYTKGDIYRNIN